MIALTVVDVAACFSMRGYLQAAAHGDRVHPDAPDAVRPTVADVVANRTASLVDEGHFRAEMTALRL
jgi:hypothetical protein